MKKENHRCVSILRRVLCVIVMLAMLVSLTACLRLSDLEGLFESSSSSSNKKPSNTTGTVGIQKNETLDLEYALTQADVDAFYDLLEELEAVSLIGEDLDTIDALSAELEELLTYLDAQSSIAALYHYSHTLDEALEEQYLDCVEICTQASDAYIQMVKRVYLSDTPAKDYLFADWTEQDIADLLAYDEQIAQLQQRNAEIAVEYRTSEDDALKISLYIEMVNNNNTIAQIYGYDNYYVYAYRNVYGRDYDQEDVAQLREYAQEYLVDLYYTSLMNFYNTYSGLSAKNQAVLENFLYSDFDTLSQDYVQLYIQSLDGSMGESLQNMVENDSFFTDADDAEAGAFTTTIGERCFCFFGPGYANSMTVVHEGGHYYAGSYSDLNMIPMDLAELHSQGNEWLFASFLDEHMPGKLYDALVNYKIYENISMILVCLMVDQFEEYIYTNDLTDFTAGNMNWIMDMVALDYFPDGDVKEMLTDMNAYWRLVVVEQPVYYISYAVSAIAAISLYTMAEEDYEHAMGVYQTLCEDMDLEAGFLGNIDSAGLISPFDERFYQKLERIVNS